MEISPNLKQKILEPKIYALIVKSIKGQVLHLGVHFTLEEAYAAACKKMQDFSPHTIGENIDIDLWNSTPVRQVIVQSLDSGKIDKIVRSYIHDIVSGKIDEEVLFKEEKVPVYTVNRPEEREKVKESKNDLMKKLIETGDITQVEKVKNLNANSRRYVIEKILKKSKKSSKKRI